MGRFKIVAQLLVKWMLVHWMSTQLESSQPQAVTQTTSSLWLDGVRMLQRASIGSCAIPGVSTGVSMAMHESNLEQSTLKVHVRGQFQRITRHQKSIISTLALKMEAIAKARSRRSPSNCSFPHSFSS